MLAQIVGDGGAAPDLLVSGWLAQPVAVGLLRPAIILPERFVKDEPRCRLEACSRTNGALPQPGPLVDRPLGALDAGPFRAPRRTGGSAAGPARTRSCWPTRQRPTGGAIMPRRCCRWPGRRPTGLRLAAAGSLALWERPSQLKRRILMLLDRDFRLEPTCPRRWASASAARWRCPSWRFRS